MPVARNIVDASVEDAVARKIADASLEQAVASNVVFDVIERAASVSPRPVESIPSKITEEIEYTADKFAELQDTPSTFVAKHLAVDAIGGAYDELSQETSVAHQPTTLKRVPFRKTPSDMARTLAEAGSRRRHW